jgi:hypothetical protein
MFSSILTCYSSKALLQTSSDFEFLTTEITDVTNYQEKFPFKVRASSTPTTLQLAVQSVLPLEICHLIRKLCLLEIYSQETHYDFASAACE